MSGCEAAVFCQISENVGEPSVIGYSQSGGIREGSERDHGLRAEWKGWRGRSQWESERFSSRRADVPGIPCGGGPRKNEQYDFYLIPVR